MNNGGNIGIEHGGNEGYRIPIVCNYNLVFIRTQLKIEYIYTLVYM